MQFNADHYFRAALERIDDSRLLYSVERFALSLYVSGLAAECLLRAFHLRRDPVFDSRHDLLRLFKDSRLAELEQDRLVSRGLNPVEARQAMIDLFGARDTLVRLWSNDYRFAAESQLRRRLRALGQSQSKSGNQVKPSALAVYNAAKIVIDRGTVLWTSAKK
jgi:hypothetical protein